MLRFSELTYHFTKYLCYKHIKSLFNFLYGTVLKFHYKTAIQKSLISQILNIY